MIWYCISMIKITESAIESLATHLANQAYCADVRVVSFFKGCIHDVFLALVEGDTIDDANETILESMIAEWGKESIDKFLETY